MDWVTFAMCRECLPSVNLDLTSLGQEILSSVMLMLNFMNERSVSALLVIIWILHRIILEFIYGTHFRIIKAFDCFQKAYTYSFISSSLR